MTVYLKVGDYRLDEVKLNEENGWQAEFGQLPAPDSLGDLQYAVVEDPVPANFTPVYCDAEIDDETKTVYIEVENQYMEPAFGNLTVSKTVLGNAADYSRSFGFTVTPSDTSVNGTYGDMTFTDGVAVFSLKHGEHKTALGLPAGLTYRVSEKEANRNGYVTKTSGADGSIRADETVSAAFVNSKDELPVPPGPSDDVPENPNQPDDGDVPVHSGTDASKTGDSANLSLWVVLLGISVVVLLGIVYCFRRQQRK